MNASAMEKNTMNVTSTRRTPATIARMLCVALLMTAAVLAAADRASAAFGIDAFSSDFVDPSGTPVTQAGSHPDLTTDLTFHSKTDANGTETIDGQIRDIEVDLPAGFYGNPQATPTCVMQDLVATDGFCNTAAQVGTLLYVGVEWPVYNMKPDKGQTAVFAAMVLSVPAKIVASVRTGGDYGITAKISNINQALPLTHTILTLWGVPADPVHDPHRYTGIFDGGHPAGVPPRPFLTAPARCEPVTTTVRADSWQDPGTWVTRSVTSPPLTGCDQLRFAANLKARPQTTVAGTPSAFDVTIDVPQDESARGLSTPTLRRAVVALPEGTRVSPASAEGLGACSDADLELGSDAEPSCPDSSKVGVVSIDTPLLAEPLTGDIILGTQRPDQLLRLFFVVRGPGLLMKIPGKVELDPVSGQPVATFDGTPQLPFASLKTSFKGGPRAALVTPKACGTYTTRATLTPWSGGPAVEVTDSFTINQGCDLAGRFEPSLSAGLVDPQAGSSSPFVFTLSRPSGQQDFSSLEATLPPGLLAHVNAVPLCPEVQAAAGSCPVAAQVGSLQVAAGAGPSPLAVPQPGRAPTAVFLAGPYKGAPFSLSIVVPAQAGPFDLGTVVVRAALLIDPDTAQVTIKSDPLPTILKGIPLDIQRLSVAMDRPGFMIAPTRCDPMAVTGRVGSSGGRAADVRAAFQVTDCASLPFVPKLKMDLTGKGQTTDDKHPALVAHLSPNAGDANLRRAKVILPLALALDPDNANGLCEPAAAATDRCPATSIVGSARAVSVLHEPLRSPVYFVRGERKDPKTGRTIKTLPKLFIPLKGEGVKVNVNASSDSPDNEHLVTTFDGLPDVPLKSFDLSIAGGAHGILVVSSADLCASNQVATVQFTGQNGRELEDDISMGTPCPLAVRGVGHSRSTVKLRLSGLGAGRVRVSGRGIRTMSRRLTEATVATLQPKLRAATKQALARGRDARIIVRVSFTPKGAKKAKIIAKSITLHG
jgi:hypothetical protein